jgi:hypothetical protein
MGDPDTSQFAPRTSANSAGWPQGSRNTLAISFLNDLYVDWLDHGARAIQQMRVERPHDYVRAVISVLPREIADDHGDDMTNDELWQRIRELAAELGITLGAAAGDAPSL